MAGWYYRIAKKYTLTPERKKICKHTTKEHLTPDSNGVLRSTHTCYRNTGRMKKNPFYCVVEFFPRLNDKPRRYLGKRAAKNSTSAWSNHPDYPMGETRKECIENIEMILKDAKHYPTLIEKEPYVAEWDSISIRMTIQTAFKDLHNALERVDLSTASLSDLRSLERKLLRKFRRER